MTITISREDVKVEIAATQEELEKLDQELNSVYEEVTDVNQYKLLWELKDRLTIARKG